jgi:tetratricopeptide (TPR) repeat protein
VLPSTKTVQRAIWITAAALALVLVLFAGYYIWDRYVHRDEPSQTEAVVAEIEQAIRHDPSNPDVRVALAESYLGSDRYAQALDQAEQVLAIYPDHEGGLLIAGIAHARLDEPAAALEPLERFVALRQDGPMARSDTALEAAYYFLGESYLNLDRPAEAVSALEGALLINPVDADALYQVGLAYGASGQLETALERYHKAVRLVPDFAEAYGAMAQGYAALGRPDHATYARGMVAFSQGDYRRAATALGQATKALPDFGPAFLGLGLTYEQLGRLAEALAATQRAIELDPGDFAAQQAAGRIQTTLDSQN